MGGTITNICITAIDVINVLVFMAIMELVFVDANVILEAVLDENSASFEYFTRFRGKSRAIITSTHAIGEVVRFLYRKSKGQDNFVIDKLIDAFRKLLGKTNLEIENVSGKTLQLVLAIIEENSRIAFKDAIHVAIAQECQCTKFTTLDSGIDRITLKKLGLKLEKPGSILDHFE